MTKGGASKLIDRLQIRGWMRKAVDPADRRCRILTLTLEGKWAVDKLATVEYLNDIRCFRRLGRELRDTLFTALKFTAVRPLVRRKPPSRYAPLAATGSTAAAAISRRRSVPRSPNNDNPTGAVPGS